MTDPVPYDAFADIYDAWAESAPITRENQEFYVKCLVEADGPAVELGVGNGRICIEAAKQGKPSSGSTLPRKSSSSARHGRAPPASSTA